VIVIELSVEVNNETLLGASGGIADIRDAV
jgi:hypothetical protein